MDHLDSHKTNNSHADLDKKISLIFTFKSFWLKRVGYAYEESTIYIYISNELVAWSSATCSKVPSIIIGYYTVSTSTSLCLNLLENNIKHYHHPMRKGLYDWRD